MKKKSKKIIICLISLLFMTILFSGCNKLNLVKVDKSYQWAYEADMSTECDADMMIDGVLSEKRYDGLDVYKHVQNGVELSVETAFSNKGVYIGAIAKDENYIWTKRMNFYKNSCFWLSIKSEDTTYEVGNAVFNFYIDEKNAWNFNGKGFKADSTKIENEGITTLTCELFLAWKDLNIDVSDGLPNCIRMNPLYRSYDGIGTYNWITGMFMFTDRDRQECSGRFGANGYINADNENAIVGNAKNGFAKSDGWNLSEAENGIIRSEVDHSQGIFFKNICSTSYIYTVSVDVGSNIYGKNPSGAGVMDAVNQIECATFYLNGVSARNKTRAEYSTLEFYKSGAYSWIYKSEGYVLPDYENYGNKVKYTVIKDGGYYYYIVNGQFLMSKYISYLQGATCPGFFTLDAAATFTDYSAEDLSDDNARVDDILETYGVYRIKQATKNTVGGTVELSVNAVNSGESVNVSVVPTNRYILSALTLTDRNGNVSNIYDTAVEQMKNGAFTIDNINSTIIINPTFTRLSDTVKVSGKITSTENKVVSGMTITIKGSNSLLFYSTISASNGDYTFYVPKSGMLTVAGKQIQVDGNYTINIKGSGYLPIKDSITVNQDAFVKNYTLKLPEYSIESYGIIKDGEEYSAAEKLSSRTTDYQYFDVKNATIAVLQAKITIPKNTTLASGTGIGFVFTDGSVLTEDKVDTQSKVRKSGNYFSKEIGLSNSGLFCSSYLIGSKSRYPGVWGSGTFSELQYDTNNTSLWTGTNQRTLTLALYDNVIYVWIDDVYITSFITTDSIYFENNIPFSTNNGYRFGVYFMATGDHAITAQITQTYGDEALHIINQENQIYKKIIFPAPKDSERISAQNNVYTIDSLAFRQSGYAYTSPKNYTQTAVYSVKINVKNIMEGSSIDGISDWTTNIGITISNGIVVSSAINGRSDVLNQYYSVQIGLNKYGLISSVGGVLALTSRLDTSSVYDEKTITTNRLTVGEEKTLTVVLYDGTLYIYVDGTFIDSKELSYVRFSTDGYSFAKTDSIKFGVNATNLDTTKNKAMIEVITEKYGNDAIEEIKDNYSNEIVANGNGVVKVNGVYNMTGATAIKIDGVWKSTVAYAYLKNENYNKVLILSTKISHTGNDTLIGLNGIPFAGIIINGKDGKSIVVAVNNYGVIGYSCNTTRPTYASDFEKARRLDGGNLYALTSDKNSNYALADDKKEAILTVVIVNDIMYVYCNDMFVRQINLTNNSYFNSFSESESYQVGILATNIDTVANLVKIEVLSEKYGQKATEEISLNPKYSEAKAN